MSQSKELTILFNLTVTDCGTAIPSVGYKAPCSNKNGGYGSF